MTSLRSTLLLLARLRHGDAAVTEYAYDVHSWPVSQQTTYGVAAISGVATIVADDIYDSIC